MSHLINPKVDTVYTPDLPLWRETWHGLQTVVEGQIAKDGSNITDVFCPIVQAGLKPDFECEVADVPEDLREEMDLSAYKVLLADCRAGKAKSVLPLHIPKKGYKVHQNKRLFDTQVAAARQVLGGDDGFELACVGTLGSYTQFMVSIAIKGNDEFAIGTAPNGERDTWKQYFNLNSSHNGLIGSNTMLALTRTVCFNTVLASVAEATEGGTISAIRHTPNSEELITPELFAAKLKTWLRQSAKIRELLTAIKAQAMSVDEFRAFTAGVFTNAGSDKLSTTSFNRLEEMTALFQRGRGNSGANRYDALNAFTEYFTSGNGVGNVKNVSKSKRLATANFGKGNDWKLEAMRIATHEEEYAATVKRGAILLNDKLIANAAK